MAKQIARYIEECGAEIFLDEADFQIGDDFEEKIRGFLTVADELAVLFTPWALDRAWVWSEVGAAWGRGIPIVCVLQGITAVELQSRSSFPVFLKARDMIDINDLDKYFEQLQARIGEE